MGLLGGDQRPAGRGRGSWRRGQSLRRGAIVLVSLVSLAVGLSLYLTDALREPELDTVDARFDLRGDQDPPADVVVVAVDDRTFRELKLRWPFPRSEHARLLDRISPGRPAAIAFDVQFTEPTKLPKSGEPSVLDWLNSPKDVALIQAVRRADDVVLSTTEVGPDGETAVLGGNFLLKQIGAKAANGNFVPDPGGVLRRLPYSIDGLTSFAVVTSEVATGEEVDPEDFDDDTLIDFAGPPATISTVSYSTVLQGKTDP